MMKKNLIFDLDEVLVVGDIIEKVSELLFAQQFVEKIYTNRDVKDYFLTNLPEIVRIKVQEAYGNQQFAVDEKTPMPGVYSFLIALESLNANIGILTSRPIRLEQATKEYIKQFFPKIRFDLGITFCNKDDVTTFEQFPKKIEYLKEIKPDFFFDDNINYCEQAASLGINTYLITNDHTGWNNNVTVSRNVKRLKNVCFFDINQLES